MRQEPRRLADHVARALGRSDVEMTRRWLDRISRRLDMRPHRVFPTGLIYDHIPLMLRSVAGQLRSTGRISIPDDVTRHLRKLARHRRRQGYDVQEVLVEFAMLGDVVFDAFVDAVARFPGPTDPAEVSRLAGRLHHVLFATSTITAGTYREAEVEQTRELSRLLTGFARTLSHELKTPLGAAEGAASLLTEEAIVETPEQRREFAERVRRNLERARALVDDLRTLAVADTGEAAIQRRGRLPQVVRDVHDEVRPAAEKADVAITIVEPIPDLEVDAARVELVLLNLVRNAIKYSDPEKPEHRVRIEARREGRDRWRVSVSDNGLGIPDERKPHVFERFFRAHPSVAEGTGLGLSIAREAVDQMGGEIGFESEEGRGSTFWFTLNPLGPDGAGSVRDGSGSP